jgi:hypothetical protein
VEGGHSILNTKESTPRPLDPSTPHPSDGNLCIGVRVGGSQTPGGGGGGGPLNTQY